MNALEDHFSTLEPLLTVEGAFLGEEAVQPFQPRPGLLAGMRPGDVAVSPYSGPDGCRSQGCRGRAFSSDDVGPGYIAAGLHELSSSDPEKARFTYLGTGLLDSSCGASCGGTAVSGTGAIPRATFRHSEASLGMTARNGLRVDAPRDRVLSGNIALVEAVVTSVVDFFSRHPTLDIGVFPIGAVESAPQVFGTVEAGDRRLHASDAFLRVGQAITDLTGLVLRRQGVFFGPSFGLLVQRGSIRLCQPRLTTSPWNQSGGPFDPDWPLPGVIPPEPEEHCTLEENGFVTCLEKCLEESEEPNPFLVLLECARKCIGIGEDQPPAPGVPQPPDPVGPGGDGGTPVPGGPADPAEGTPRESGVPKDECHKFHGQMWDAYKRIMKGDCAGSCPLCLTAFYEWATKCVKLTSEEAKDLGESFCNAAMAAGRCPGSCQW
jgi:hypothetical protein